jgi:signal transduction histidine kinase
VFTSGAFHFGLRLFQDLCLVLMIGFYFEKNKIKHLNKILLVYLVSISSLFLMWSFGLREYKFFLYLMYCFSPLIFFPMVYGFYYSSNLDKSDSTKKGLMFFFLLMMLVQINDLFSFWQIYNGFFFVRFYPNALILLFGLLYSRREIQKRLNLEKNSLIFDLTQQVSHDIRSPLAALEMISGSLNELPEDKRLIIRNSINRIRDIANSLLDKNRANKNAFIETIPEELNESPATALPSEEFTTILLSPLVDSIVTEKRIQYRNHIGVRIEFNQTVASYGLFASIQPNEFQRVLSNLINNAVEAFPNHEGLVEIVMQSDSEGLIEIVIKDNGKGIPESIIAKLGTRGETHGKEGGSGLGIFHAKQTVESFKGSLKIESKPSQGTVISIHLPREVEQKWFVPKISIAANQTIIVFDDDQSIHQIWDGRLASLPGYESLVVHHFSGPAEIRKFYGKNFIDLDEALFLMDYEIGGSNETGLDVIESLGIQNQSILVTSRYEEKAIRQRCDQLGVKLIPKSMSGFVPMEIV